MMVKNMGSGQILGQPFSTCVILGKFQSEPVLYMHQFVPLLWVNELYLFRLVGHLEQYLARDKY